MRQRFLILALATIIMSCLAANAQLFNGTLYFTTNAGGQDVHSITYSYNQTTQSLSLGSINNIAALPGADGIIHAPNGNLLDPSGMKFYTSDFRGPLDTVPLPLAQGSTTFVTGGDSGVTQVAFAPNGSVFYVDGSPNCCGNLGLINLSTGVTTRLYSSVTPAHGLIYDPFTGLMTFFGDGETGTMNQNGGNLMTSPGQFTCDFDQGSVDGHGHAFVAGCGEITFLGYSISHDYPPELR